MSDRESQQASIDASEASLPAENGSREVENDPRIIHIGALSLPTVIVIVIVIHSKSFF